MPSTLLMKRDLRSRPSQTISLFVLIALAAALLHTAVLLVTDYSHNVERKADELNASSMIAITTASPLIDVVDEHLRNDATVTGHEISDSWSSMAGIDIGGNTLSALVQVINIDEPVTYGQARVVGDSDPSVDDPIWVPAMMGAGDGLKLGDELVVDTVEGDVTFHVAGFIEELFGGAPGMGMLTLGMNAAAFERFDAKGFRPTYTVKVDAATPADGLRAFEAALSAAQEQSTAEQSIFSLWGTDRSILVQASGLSSSIIVAMLVGLAAAITLIALVVTWFLLRNVITADMVNIGALRAAGYTTMGVIGSLVMTQGALALVAALVGSGASYLLTPMLNDSFKAQNGLDWQVSFSWLALAVTVAALVGVVVATATLVSLSVRRVTTVAALRGGIATHSTTTTRLPLDTARGPLAMLLGLKAAMRQGTQNALVALTAALVAFSAVFALGMSYSLMGDKQKATELLVGKIEDVWVQARPDVDLAPIIATARELPGVTRVHKQSFNGLNVDGVAIGFAIYDHPETDAFDPLVEGRMPRHANEVAMGGKLANMLNLRVGDSWAPDLGSGSADFVLTGLTSSARNMGQNVTLSTAGYQRLAPWFKQEWIGIYADGDLEPIIDRLAADYGDQLLSVSNVRESIDAQISGYLTMVPIVGGLIMVFTVVVTTLVIGLVVTSMLLRSRRELGVKKAMGFTNGQLTAQTRWTYLPAIAIGAVVGVLAGTGAMSPLISLLLRGVGLMKVQVDVNWLHPVAVGLGMIAVAWLTISALSLRIRGISAYQLVTI